MSRRLVVLVLMWGAFLRFTGITWDNWRLQNPDERFLMMVSAQLEVPGNLAEAIDPARATMNPNNRGFEFYVYGALPPTLVRVAAGLLGVDDLAGMTAVARVMSILCDVAGTLLVMLLAARFGGGRCGLLAGVLYASCPLLLQQARFATVDVWGTVLVVLAAWAVVGVEMTTSRAALAGAAVGLAVACKPNLALAMAIPIAAVAAWWWQGRRGRHAAKALGLLAVAGGAALLAAKLADPGAFAAWWSPLPNPRRLAALQQLAGFLDGRGQFPPNLQWADRRAVLDPLANLLLWGTGPLLGVSVLFGGARVVRRALLGERRWLPILMWLVPAVGWHLSGFVVSVRHLEPFLPFGIVAGALWLAHRHRWTPITVVAGTMVVALAWAAIAWRPHTRVEASRWLVANFPADAVVSAEYWDDALPLAGEGSLRTVTMRVFEADTVEKREHLIEVLDQVDAVVVSSQRGVGTICRVPDAYPITSEYYHLLFSGALGFDLAARFQRHVGFGPVTLSDLSAEESLSVYDHPPVWIFRKTDRYSHDLARLLLTRPSPGPRRWETRDLEARGSPPFSMRWRDANVLPGPFTSRWWGQLVSLLAWVAWIELAGVAGWWLLRRFVPLLPDGGWFAARFVGLVGLGVAWLWMGWLRVPGWNSWLPSLALVAAVPWGWSALRRAWPLRAWRWSALLFWAVFAAFLLIRAGNPEIYWGEKPMDASVLAGIWRASSLPPVDPWFAGARLDYYFFGFLPYALPARALAIGPGVAFNLAAATVPACVASVAAGLGWLLSRRLAGGLLAALLAQGVGTAGILFRPQLLSAGDFNVFWASSRVISDTINEYPLWTALFADLHAHFFGLPGFLLGLLLASAVALAGLDRRTALLGGAVIAVEAMTNTWEAPVLVGALVMGCAFARVRVRGWRGWVARARWLSLAAVAAIAVSLPYWWSVRGAVVRVFWSAGASPPLSAYSELFGVPATLTAVALVVTLVRGGGRAATWSWLLIGMGVALVLAPEVLTVSDRMNTVFKFHLMAHVLLACGVAGALASAPVPSSVQWRWLLRTAVAVPVVIGLMTAAGCVMTVLATRRVAGPRPTLDGNRYLAFAFPDQAPGLETLAALTPSGPVLEPPGTPYTDTLRVPMFSGQPAVVGWEYHLWQRRHAWPEIRVRQTDLDMLLTGADAEFVAALARRYRLLGAVSWAGEAPAVARALGWSRAAGPERAGVFVSEETR